VGLRRLAAKLLGPSNLDEVEMVSRVIAGTPGTMIDVGAHQGAALAPFLANGWTVHAFEPDPANRAILSSRYPAVLIRPTRHSRGRR